MNSGRYFVGDKLMGKGKWECAVDYCMMMWLYKACRIIQIIWNQNDNGDNKIVWGVSSVDFIVIGSEGKPQEKWELVRRSSRHSHSQSAERR